MSAFLKKPTRGLIIGFGGLALAAGFLAVIQPAFSQTAPVFSLQVSPPLAFSGDKVTVSVLAQNFSTASTTFTWFRDNVKLAAASGPGRSSTTIATDPARQEIIQIRVEANPGPGFSRGEETALIYTLQSPAQQEEVLSGITSDFTLEVSKLNPDAGETVTAEVVTFAFDKNSANYQWFVNGVLQKESGGRGQTRFSVAAGAEGQAKTIRVDVATPSGEFRSKSAVIQTVSSPLYWWADTIVPYWYKGKALPTLNSRVTAAALPNTRNPGQLSYQWKFNDGIIPQSSGFGKSTFSFTLAFPVKERIDVLIKDAAGTFSKSAGIGIEPISPSVGVYEVKPLRGIAYERQLTDFSAPSGDSYDFLAAPFFFPKEREKNLAYAWTLNGQAIIGTFSKPWLFTLESRMGETTANQLGVEVSDPGSSGEREFASFQANLK